MLSGTGTEKISSQLPNQTLVCIFSFYFPDVDVVVLLLTSATRPSRAASAPLARCAASAQLLRAAPSERLRVLLLCV